MHGTTVTSASTSPLPVGSFLVHIGAILNRAATEGASSIGPAYQVTPPKLQHFHFFRPRPFMFAGCYTYRGIELSTLNWNRIIFVIGGKHDPQLPLGLFPDLDFSNDS
jgi:hypothetical protein